MKTPTNSTGKFIAILILCVLTAAAGQWSCAASTFLVYNNNDSGTGSLRQAVLNNNATGGGNTIVFSNVVTGKITLTSGELLITKYVTITGPGPKTLAVDGNASNRVFHMSSSNNAVNAVVSGLTITNGTANFGGGVWNDHATVTLSNCVVTGNSGGGIFNDGSVSSSTATLYMYACTVNSNSTSGDGGGIYNYGDGGNADISVSTSTISSNNAGSSEVGGGIFNDGNSGFAGAALTECTLSGNSAGEGAAIWNTGAGSGFGSLGLDSCTFCSNSASLAAGAIFNNGAGGTASVTIDNTILKTGASGVNIVNNGGTINSFGFNLSSDNAAGFFTNATDHISTDPLLGPLADNGGPTFTHALLSGSPAIDKGKDFGATIDQRGQPRTFDFASIANEAGGDGTDIGAFEVGRPTLAIQPLGNSAVLSWPSYYGSGQFSLQSSTNISSSNYWTLASGSAAVVGNQYQQTNSPLSAIKFFRLKLN